MANRSLTIIIENIDSNFLDGFIENANSTAKEMYGVNPQHSDKIVIDAEKAVKINKGWIVEIIAAAITAGTAIAVEKVLNDN